MGDRFAAAVLAAGRPGADLNRYPGRVIAALLVLHLRTASKLLLVASGLLPLAGAAVPFSLRCARPRARG